MTLELSGAWRTDTVFRMRDRQTRHYIVTSIFPSASRCYWHMRRIHLTYPPAIFRDKHYKILWRISVHVPFIKPEMNDVHSKRDELWRGDILFKISLLHVKLRTQISMELSAIKLYYFLKRFIIGQNLFPLRGEHIIYYIMRVYCQKPMLRLTPIALVSLSMLIPSSAWT
jgi:hypothetical protein